MMKYKIFLLALCALLPLGTWADDLAFTVTPGADGECKLAVSLNNTAQYCAFQLDVVLPEGATFTDGNVSASGRLADFNVQAVNHPNGHVRVASVQNRNQIIAGNSGVLFTLSIQTSALAEDAFGLHNAIFVTKNMEEVTLYLSGSSSITEEQIALNTALQTLVNEAAAYLANNNYSTLSGYKAFCQALESGRQAAENWSATQSHIDQLQSALADYRAAVEQYLVELEEAQRLLNETLSSLVAEAQALQQDELYTVVSASSKNTLSTLLQSAEEELASEKATQTTINNLRTFVILIQKEIEAERARLHAVLQSQVDEASTYLAGNDYPTLSGYTDVNQALETARQALTNSAATQALVDQLQSALATYRTAVEQYLAELEAQRLLNENLSTLVAEAQKIQQDELYYAVSADNQSVLTDVLAKAAEELSNGKATQSTLESLTAAVDQAQMEIDAERKRLDAIVDVRVQNTSVAYDLTGRRVSQGRIIVRNGKKYLK